MHRGKIAGDVVFANSTCFDDDLMKKTAAAVAALKEGAIVITTTDPVPSPALEILEEVGTDDGAARRAGLLCFASLSVSSLSCRSHSPASFFLIIFGSGVI